MEKTDFKKLKLIKESVKKQLSKKDNELFIYIDNEGVIYCGSGIEVCKLFAYSVCALSDTLGEDAVKNAFNIGLDKDLVDTEVNILETVESEEE